MLWLQHVENYVLMTGELVGSTLQIPGHAKTKPMHKGITVVMPSGVAVGNHGTGGSRGGLVTMRGDPNMVGDGGIGAGGGPFTGGTMLDEDFRRKMLIGEIIQERLRWCCRRRHSTPPSTFQALEF
jgi:hypothetical protein